MTKKLIVITRHRPTVLLAKGEYIARYYNPGNVFGEVHLLLTNQDMPEAEQLQFTAGKAKLFIHNLPRPDFRKTLGWRPYLIRKWIKAGIDLVRDIDPDLIRVHNNFLEGYLGMKIKRKLDVPYLVSIHHSEWQFKNTLQNKILGWLLAKYERGSLEEAAGVIAVYLSNFEYAKMLKGGDPRLIYNVVSDEIPVKKHYGISKPPKIITINQQKKQKNPSNILRAIVDIDCEYWIVGNGPDHQQLLDLAESLGVMDKVKFSTGIPNNELTKMLPSFDLHVSHCDVWGMSKTVVESSLAALPTLINYHPSRPIPEYSDEWLFRCENSPEGYRSKLIEVLGNEPLRKKKGQAAHNQASEHFNPREMEKKLSKLYQEKMLMR